MGLLGCLAIWADPLLLYHTRMVESLFRPCGKAVEVKELALERSDHARRWRQDASEFICSDSLTATAWRLWWMGLLVWLELVVTYDAAPGGMGGWRAGSQGGGLAGYLVATMLLGACFGRTAANLFQLVGIEPHFHPGILDLSRIGRASKLRMGHDPMFPSTCLRESESTNLLNLIVGRWRCSHKAVECLSGVYAMIGAASMLAGVCRVHISLVVIMTPGIAWGIYEAAPRGELTGALELLVPFMIAVFAANWVGL